MAYAFRRGTPFWERMSRPGPSSCWEWQAGRSRGYGWFQRQYAHRVAWELTHGPVPDGLWVLHRCDNPPCCNPAHLYLGTIVENMRDASVAGTLSRGQGEDHPAAKFANATITQARKLRDSGLLLREISDLLGIEESYCSRICRSERRP